jgi:beta-glucosidase
MAQAWGKGMGEEFFAKGSNVQLGPGMCVARVPHNGRNFEYLSGEEPMLGVGLIPAVVNGIQGEGVIANAKHWVNNNQETHRTTVSENVDERTQFELYYPTFEAAIKANVGSVMCR